MAWHSVRRLLDDRLRGASWGRGATAALVLERAQDHLGVHLPAEVRGLVRAQYWQRHVLTIIVQHPALVYTVRALQEGLREHIEQTTRQRPREIRILVRGGSATGPSSEDERP